VREGNKLVVRGTGKRIVVLQEKGEGKSRSQGFALLKGVRRGGVCLLSFCNRNGLGGGGGENPARQAVLKH